MRSNTRNIFVFLIIMMTTWSAQQVRAQETVEHPDVTISVEGLACPICAYGLEKSLKKIDTVEAVSIHIRSGEVRMKLQEGSEITETQLREAVTDAGFTLKGIQYADDKDDSGGRSR